MAEGKILTGKEFENDFKASCKKQGIFIERLKDTPMSYNRFDAKGLKFTPKNPYDFHVYKMPFLYAMELKHTKYSSMSIEQEDDPEENNKMIKRHQIKGLERASKFEGVKAGFVLTFYVEKKQEYATVFLSIQDFLDFEKSTTKKSINLIDAVTHNAIVVSQEFLRTHYEYNVAELLSKIK